MKKILLGSLIMLCLISSCSKESGEEKKEVVTYKLVIGASVPGSGKTLASISFRNSDSTIVKDSISIPFEKSFEIPVGFNIVYDFSGTNDSQSLPAGVEIYYEVNQLINGVNQKVLCSTADRNVSGEAGKWIITANINKTFNGSGCK